MDDIDFYTRLPSTMEELEDFDRNARAYGFEIGRGKAMTETIQWSDDNPFLHKNWREKVERKS